ncbi:hypothetical protein F5B19DRAFT_498660 [Rostrohypoxylon terebratum]|nr:hypothetical protein F5B19DRAFT_498660 [Rostrohypoxylon terebratum]
MSGIGSQMAISLAKGSPTHILIASRAPKKVDPVLENITEINSSFRMVSLQVDLTDYGSIRRAAKEILATIPRIDVLADSAGNVTIKHYTVDKQGIEIQLSADYLSHFLLTNLLALALINAPSVTAVAPFTSVAVVSRTARPTRSNGVTSTGAHPGCNNGTQLGSHSTVDDYPLLPEITKRNASKGWERETPRYKTFDQICSTSLAAALDPEIPAKSPTLELI